MSEYYLDYTGSQLDDAINKVRSGYILPSGNSPKITSNGTHNVKQYENAVVDVPVPDNYINLSDVLFHCTKSASGTFVGSGQTCSKLSIGLSFRPKIILIIAPSLSTSNTASPYDINTVWRVYDNDFTDIRDNCALVYKSGTNARGGHTASSGLFGNENNTITGWGTNAKFTSGTTYNWYAYG